MSCCFVQKVLQCNLKAASSLVCAYMCVCLVFLGGNRDIQPSGDEAKQ